MNKLLLLVIVLFAVPLASAITITAPTQDVSALTLPASVTASWQGNYTTYNILITRNGVLHTEQNTTQNSLQLSLQEGNYQLTISAENASDTRVFSVLQTPVELSITTQRTTYEVQETVHLTATASRTVTATLNIKRNNVIVDTYTIPLESSVNLIYIPQQPGTYQAELIAQSQQVSRTFTVNEKEPLTVSFTRSPAIVNRQTQFNATATGGTAPYTYQWLFSDETTSTGRNVVHYFFEEGEYTATLVVTDADGEQKSTVQTFTVTHPSYSLDVVVRRESGALVQGAKIHLTQTGYNETKTTTSSGLASFTQLRGNYTLVMEYQNTTQTEIMLMDRDKSKVYTLPNPVQEIPSTPPPVVESIEPEEQTQSEEPQAPEPEPIQAQTAQPTVQELRAQAKEDITQRKFNLQLSSQKDGVLKTLGLYALFDQALRQLDSASETQIPGILKQIPTGVSVRDEKTTISYPQPEDIISYTEELIELRGVQDEKLARQYRHSIQQAADDVLIKTTKREVTITYEDKTEEYVIVTREVTAPEDSYVVEFIPSTLAQDVSKLTIQGQYDVLRSNPVLRFSSHEYTYYAQVKSSQAGYALVVPQQLQSPPGLLGMVTVRLGETNPMRGILYIFLLAIFVVGILAGGKISKKRQSQQIFEEFTQLAHDALDAINNGAGHHAATVTDEIIAIYHQLPVDQQESVRDIIEHLTHNQQEQHFFTVLSTAYDTINTQADINAVSAVYEETLLAYEQLDKQSKQYLQEHIEQLHAYLDNYTQ